MQPCGHVHTHTRRHAYLWAETVHRHTGGRKSCMISSAPMPQVSTVPLEQQATTHNHTYTHTHAHAWQSCKHRMRAACAALPARTRLTRPVGTCVRTRVCGMLTGRACRRCARVRWMYPSPSGWIISGVLSPPIPALLVHGVRCGKGGSSGHPLAGPTAASPPQRAGSHPSLYLFQLKHLCIPTAALT